MIRNNVTTAELLRNSLNKANKGQIENFSLPISNDYAKIRLRTREQVEYALSKNRTIFIEKVELPNGNVFEYPYILVAYEDAIRYAI